MPATAPTAPQQALVLARYGRTRLLQVSGSDAGRMCVSCTAACMRGMGTGKRRAIAVGGAVGVHDAATGPRKNAGRPLSAISFPSSYPPQGIKVVERVPNKNVSAVRYSSTFTSGFSRTRAMTLNSRPTQVRRDSQLSGPYETYEAVVVGAGPAGITAVGNLLENRVEPILWVDDAFDGGRVNKYYREVPSNTKVKLFIDFATAVAPFRKIVSGVPSRDRWEEPSPSDGAPVEGKPDKLQDLRQLDQEKGCHLSNAADMCVMLTQGLRRTPGVITQKGRVAEASFDEQSNKWSVNVDSESKSPQDISSAQAKRIVLCTGSSPTDPPLAYEPEGLKHIHLDTALSPTKLSALFSSAGPTTVAVVGASHSAVLVLMNLSQLALSNKSDLKIKWFTRHPLRYAEYEDGFIARDNTGLKGEAAVWARENLEPETLPKSPISQCLTKIAYEKGDEEAVYKQHLNDCQYVVQAIGYQRDTLPALKTSDGKEIVPHFDHDKGVFNYVRESDCGSMGDLQQLPGAYGAGIAFPQRVVDRKYGHEEFNVGFFKFMKAVKGWVEGWKGAV